MHPILFHIGDFYIGTYGLLIVAGLMGGLALARRLAAKRDIPADPLTDLAFIVLLTGFLGARVAFILLNLGEFVERPLAYIFAREGFVFLGGFVAAVGATVVFLRKRRLPMWEVGDLSAPALALGHSIGRIGCFAAGCCYGKPVPEGLWLGVAFPLALKDNGDPFLSFAYFDHLQRGLIDSSATHSLPVYPTQLIESVANLVIAGLLVLIWRKKKFAGQVFACYLLFYGFARFNIEFLRGDTERGIFFDGLLSTSQILSLIGIAAGAIIWYVRRPGKTVSRAKPAH